MEVAVCKVCGEEQFCYVPFGTYVRCHHCEVACERVVSFLLDETFENVNEILMWRKQRPHKNVRYLWMRSNPHPIKDNAMGEDTLEFYTRILQQVC